MCFAMPQAIVRKLRRDAQPGKSPMLQQQRAAIAGCSDIFS